MLLQLLRQSCAYYVSMGGESRTQHLLAIKLFLRNLIIVCLILRTGAISEKPFETFQSRSGSRQSFECRWPTWSVLNTR